MLAVITDKPGDAFVETFNAILEVIENNPNKKLAVVSYDDVGDCICSYYKCTHNDLQKFAMCLLDDATLRLIAANKDRIEELEAEIEAEE